MANTMDVTQNPLLTKLAVNYRNRSYIAPLIFPFVPVPKESGQYAEWDSGVRFRRPNTTYGPNASANELDIKGSKKDFVVTPRAQAAWVDPSEEQQADDFSPKAMKTETLMDVMGLDLECEMAAMLTDQAQMTQFVNVAGADQWDAGTSKPKKYILTQRAKIIANANTLIVGRPAWDALLTHAEIIDAVKYTKGAVDVSDVIAAYFQVKRVLVGEAFVDSAKEGKAQNLGYVWGKHAILCYVAEKAPTGPAVLTEQPSLGYIPIRGMPGGTDASAIYRVFEGAPHPSRGRGQGSTYLKVETELKPLLQAPKFGVLLTGIVS